MEKSKRLLLKSKRSARRPLPRIQSGDQIDYRNISLISQFFSEQGKILSRRVNRLTLKQQRFITLAIKQARILSLLPFLNNELYDYKKKYFDKKKDNKKQFDNNKQFKRRESTTRTRGLRTQKKQK